MVLHGPIFVSQAFSSVPVVPMIGIGLLGELQVRHYHEPSRRAPYSVDRVLALAKRRAQRLGIIAARGSLVGVLFPGHKTNGHEDRWTSGADYDRWMGRWSRLLAREFLGVAEPSRAVCAGPTICCGSGVLTEAHRRAQHYLRLSSE